MEYVIITEWDGDPTAAGCIPGDESSPLPQVGDIAVTTPGARESSGRVPSRISHLSGLARFLALN